jgi:diguanylate cyclase (GGDEF)-like protein
MKILVVDDSPDAVALARARLAFEGHEIVAASDGPTGLEAAQQQRPDLILLDLDMPGMSGFEVCRAIKADANLCMIPVIFLTAYGCTADKVEGLELGAVDYVIKPFDPIELRARVRAALRTKRLQDLLIQHAQVDPLTELPNRRALDDRLAQEWARIRRHGGCLSLIMADVDHFKRVNDRHGHPVGDRLLQWIARCISEQCRQTDLPCRYGGEEFAVLCPQQALAGAAALAERCRHRVAGEPMKGERGPVEVTASFGVASSDASPQGADCQDVVKRADEALYEAKAAGRNRVQCAEQPQPAEPAPS